VPGKDGCQKKSENAWRLSSGSGRTHFNTSYPFVYLAPSLVPNRGKPRFYRNPLVLAMELKTELKRDGVTQAELARRHGMTRARVTQWLSLLELPRQEIEKLLAMGDYWERRLVTERGLRKQRRQSL
jgi:predicted XRE-type DNA-binding protein